MAKDFAGDTTIVEESTPEENAALQGLQDIVDGIDATSTEDATEEEVEETEVELPETDEADTDTDETVEEETEEEETEEPVPAVSEGPTPAMKGYARSVGIPEPLIAIAR